MTVDSHEIDVGHLQSKVLERLIEEIRNNTPSKLGRYDRIHNRHNRGV
jgi:hypothetical protein